MIVDGQKRRRKINVYNARAIFYYQPRTNDIEVEYLTPNLEVLGSISSGGTVLYS